MSLLHDTQAPTHNQQPHGHQTRPRHTDRPDAIPLTPAARRELERELANLREQRKREIPTRLRAAREFGDLTNNDEYLDVREEEALLVGRIARLENILMRAVTVNPADNDDTVAIGSQVTVVDINTGQPLQYTIVGAHDARRPGTVSALSPVGKALLGCGRGDQVRVELPNRRAREFKLRDVRVAQVA